MPERVQLSRAKGWRKPENTVVVARPSKWGNPSRVGGSAKDRGEAVALFATHAVGVPPFTAEHIREQLVGKNLACWCPLDGPCHADLLLDIANAT
jgi:hypothetical protein